MNISEAASIRTKIVAPSNVTNNLGSSLLPRSGKYLDRGGMNW
jgi:hypothetical protein